MKLTHVAAAASLTVFMAASPALAMQFGAENGGAEDYIGTYSIGVDISHVGWSPQAAHEFAARLSPAKQASVDAACRFALTNPTSYHPDVLMFCRNLTAE
jgi:hypothetical protein